MRQLFTWLKIVFVAVLATKTSVVSAEWLLTILVKLVISFSITKMQESVAFVIKK